MNIQKNVKIAASKEAIWDYLVDPEKLRKWNPEILRDEPMTSGPARVGSKSKVLMQEGPKTAEYESEVIEFLPYEKLAISLKGGSLGSSLMFVTYQLEEAGSVTKLNYHARWQPKELMLRAISPVIGAMATKNASEATARLKALVEDRGPELSV